jgi:hypothetical protein
MFKRGKIIKNNYCCHRDRGRRREMDKERQREEERKTERQKG